MQAELSLPFNLFFIRIELTTARQGAFHDIGPPGPLNSHRKWGMSGKQQMYKALACT